MWENNRVFENEKAALFIFPATECHHFEPARAEAARRRPFF